MINAEEMHSPGKLTQVGLVGNVHYTQIKRGFCKPATKSDSNTIHDKELVQIVTEMTRDGDDILNLKPMQFKKISTVQTCKFSQKLLGTYLFQDESGRFSCFFLVCVLEPVR